MQRNATLRGIMMDADWQIAKRVMTKAARRSWKAAHPGKKTHIRALPMPDHMKPSAPYLARGAIINFGKFAGWTWPQVAALDPSYCAWAISRPFVRNAPRLYADIRDALLVVLADEQLTERQARLLEEFG
jgi:hypothetical protein